MNGEQKIIIIAGANGAGKTTFAREFLPHEANCPIFINADLIAAGLSPFAPETAAVRAARLMLDEIAVRVRRRDSFALETTLSGLTYARSIPAWQRSGYQVKLIFLQLPNAELAIARVAARVAQGGHHIPDAIIRRRFARGWLNFNETYKKIVDSWLLYDNSSTTPTLLAEGEKQ